MPRWTKDELTYLRGYYPWYGPDVCARHLGRSPDAVRNKASSMMLVVGEPTSYIAISDISGGKDKPDYHWLTRKAEDDGVLKHAGKQRRRLVPNEWADKINAQLERRREVRQRTKDWLTLREFASMLDVHFDSVANAMSGRTRSYARLHRHIKDVRHHRPDDVVDEWKFHPNDARLAALKYTPYDPATQIPKMHAAKEAA